jgi:hypothetical protein
MQKILRQVPDCSYLPFWLLVTKSEQKECPASNSRTRGARPPNLQPLGHAAVMRTCSSSALAKAVTPVTALCGCSLRSRRAVLWPVHGFAFAIYILTVVCTFGLRLLLLSLLLGLLVGWLLLCGLSERWKQNCSEHENCNESAHDRHGVSFLEKARRPSFFSMKRRQAAQTNFPKKWLSLGVVFHCSPELLCD